MSSSSLFSLLLFIGATAAIFDDTSLPAAAAAETQTRDSLRQKMIDTCNFPSERMTADQYSLCTRLVSLFRMQLVNEEKEEEGGQIPLAKRKASFIRFGKRSSPLEYEEIDSVPEKRKASFIRFGRR
ncbi:hypothetical protein PRIPAC_77345 [Pristionchus pacificus]|uniref:Uncharacterized protein n=1 Tax=Pristionchus pacificus TaxID=54126 RepID=A0A2A6CAW4_PRIPA|nr:hypothetical protein PRIPAC_77345 [Pristionchus pacificus]|eukprot:PDM75240.1 hypothetical protein PRIPAC_43434 [Pristionchus pacificus]